MLKQFLMKKALRMKGVSKEQADEIAKKLEEHPELLDAMKSLDKNPEVKALFENMQKEIAEKTAAGMPEQYAAVAVAGKYKAEIAKHRETLAPLMALMGKL